MPHVVSAKQRNLLFARELAQDVFRVDNGRDHLVNAHSVGV